MRPRSHRPQPSTTELGGERVAPLGGSSARVRCP